MTPALMGSVVRWLITMAGANAWLTQDDVTQVVGLLASIGALCWSLWQKKTAYDRERR